MAVEIIPGPDIAPYNVPPTYTSPPMPTPPRTCSAPVLVEVDAVLLVIETLLLVTAPRLVTLCRVLVFHTTTAPIEDDTAVSVPAVIELTAKLLMVAVVNIRESLMYDAVPTYNAPPMPTPPRTCNAPVLVEVAEVVLVIVDIPLNVTDVALNTPSILVPVTLSVPLKVAEVALITPKNVLVGPPTNKPPPIPTPPTTWNAPVCVLIVAELLTTTV